MAVYMFEGRRLHHLIELRVLQSHWAGVPHYRIEAAKKGRNFHCVDCSGDTSQMAYGLRCLPCYQAVRVGRKAAA